MLLLAGGNEDPSIGRLVDCARERDAPYFALLVGKDCHPRVTWEIPRDRLIVNGRETHPRSAFIRHDVFTHMRDNRPESAFRAYSWYSALASWIAAHPAVRAFNRHAGSELLKPYQLHLAAATGIPVPESIVTNDLALLRRKAVRRPLVVKPINGGDYCQPLAPLLSETPAIAEAAASPAIVQEELVQPDVRVFCVGDQTFCYQIESDALDYRNASFNRVQSTNDVPKRLLERIRRLSRRMRLEFSATDLKWSSRRRELLYLETNSAPMFAAFDVASGGALCGAIIEQLDRSSRS